MIVGKQSLRHKVPVLWLQSNIIRSYLSSEIIFLSFIPIIFAPSCRKVISYHDYIHSFRFAQAQNVMKMFPWAYFFFIILPVGNSVYYKSRGGEWAVRLAGWPNDYMCSPPFQAQISVSKEHGILSLYKQSRLWLRRSVNAVSPYNL